jgi:hypothetical protein
LRPDVSGRTLTEVRVGTALLLTMGIALASCGRPRPPPIPAIDAGPDDTGPPPQLDSDGDGLCDRDENERRTDPFSADTDVDGFSDYVESVTGSDPFLIDSPNRDLLVFLRDEDGSYVDVPISFSVRGVGETFSGAYAPQPVLIPDDGTTATTFYAGGRTAGASPMENVRGTTEDERFRGVFGRTLLAFSMRFEQRQSPRGCMRAYPFAYTLKRDDGSYAGNVFRWLVIAPNGMQPGAPGAIWCGPADGTCH